MGYQRTLQATDLWKLDEARLSGPLSAKLDAAWDKRVRDAEDWNRRLDAGEIHPAWYLRMKWFFIALLFWRQGPWSTGSGFGERRAALESHWRTVGGRKEPSLTWALNDVLGFSFWLGGGFKVSFLLLSRLLWLSLLWQVLGDTSQLMGPIIVRVSIRVFLHMRI